MALLTNKLIIQNKKLQHSEQTKTLVDSELTTEIIKIEKNQTKTKNLEPTVQLNS